MNISIIIPVYKRTEWMERCIERIQSQKCSEQFEVIIVDDGSPNGRLFETITKNVKQQSDRAIHYLKKVHAGPAAARNYGVQFSKGKILCFLDDDSMPEKDWLEEITRPFYSDSSVGVVSGKTLSLDRSESLSLLLEKAVYPRKSWASCNIAYSSKVFNALGGFDEYFTQASWEDNDLGLRARWGGYVQRYNEKAIVYHPHENTLEEYKRKCLVNGRGAALFSRKYMFKKPLWAFAAPFLMSRRLSYGVFPAVWRRRIDSALYIKFLWSFLSLKGFINEIMRRRHDDN